MSKFICIVLGFGLGFFLALISFGKHIEDNPTQAYAHWKLEQSGYNYCPYCGESLRGKE